MYSTPPASHCGPAARPVPAIDRGPGRRSAGTEKNWGSLGGWLAGVPRADDWRPERGGLPLLTVSPCGQLPPAEIITRPTGQSSVGLTERLALAAIFAAMPTTRGIRPASEARRSTVDRQGLLRSSPFRPVTVSEGRWRLVRWCRGLLGDCGLWRSITAVDGL